VAVRRPGRGGCEEGHSTNACSPGNVENMSLHVLPDQRVADIRPIRSDDGARLQAYHLGLSDESRYRRFLGVKPRLSDADTRYLVEIDGSDHYALVATTVPSDEGPGEIVAVARFIRFRDAPDTAEFAVVVGDDFHRQGLAGELMNRLAIAARKRGITRFRASMLADDVAIRRIMAGLAAGPVHVLERGQVIALEIELRAEVGAVAA
jgi:RimJ/RimL family protein N-acetyltransferase